MFKKVRDVHVTTASAVEGLNAEIEAQIEDKRLRVRVWRDWLQAKQAPENPSNRRLIPWSIQELKRLLKEAQDALTGAEIDRKPIDVHSPGVWWKAFVWPRHRGYLSPADIKASADEPRHLRNEPGRDAPLEAGGRHFWFFRDVLYETDHELKPVEAAALLLESENKVKAKIARARALLEQVQTIEERGREPIPETVRVAVWNRDSGRCVRCGSNKNLEFDHIIPFSKGGANTFRNLQLLCEPCNRSKAATI